MLKAIIVDSDYGSVTKEKQLYIKDEYAKNGIELAIEHFESSKEIIENCQEADVLLCTGNPEITEEVLENLPNLKVIQRFGIGVNSINLDAATKHGVLVLYMPGFCANELANHSLALVMNVLRNVSFYDRKIRAGEWPKAQGPVPRDPRNLVLGLYGFGSSAKPLYHLFKNAFNSKVIVHDRFVPETITDDYEIELVEFDELLTQADIVSVHVPLTDETKHSLNKEAFKLMKKDSMVVNIARGPIINEDDLVEALENGEIGFAGLDVFEKEPLDTNHKLKTMDNVVLTPHSAFYGDQAQTNQIQWSIDLVDNVLNKNEIEEKYIANQAVESKIENLRRL